MKDKLSFVIKYYFPLLIWAAIIFYFSGISSLKYSEEIKKEIFLRKGAHFFEFGVLVFLFWRIFYSGYQKSVKLSFFYSLFLSVLYAFSDEFHQSLVYGRTGKLIDIFFDLLSALAVLELILFLKFKNYAKKILFWLIVTFFVMAAILFFMLSKIQTAEMENQSVQEDKLTAKEEKTKNKIPDKIEISVPFTSQAPTKIWDEFHEEACEEASLVMLKYYLANLPLSTETAEREIQGLIAFQNKEYGDYKDTTAVETVKLAKYYYGINNLKVVYDFSLEDLKKYLSYGKPIIIPAAGRLLGNPYFTQPGPLYHSLVLTGYNGNTIIANDPGTKRGENYKYNMQTLYNAIHDFTGNKDDIEKGRKAMIVWE